MKPILTNIEGPLHNVRIFIECGCENTNSSYKETAAIYNTDTDTISESMMPFNNKCKDMDINILYQCRID